MKATAPGTVYLVGAGPGDPDLITVRGLNILREADVVVYDRLAPAKLLEETKAEAMLIDAGKRPGEHKLTQTDINETLIRFGRDGKSVCRLKGGDPFVFGRGGEEALAMAEAGIPWEAVPGISSAIAVPGFAGIPVTHRGVAASFAVFTGNDPAIMEWDTIVRFRGTLIFLMAGGTAEVIVKEMLRRGIPPTRAAAMVREGSTMRQRTVVGTVSNIASLAKRSGISAPVVLVIGDAAGLGNQLDWFESRPLFGKRVVITRARSQASSLNRKLSALGAEVVELPVIRVVPPHDDAPMDEALRSIERYDWVAFTSANAVNYFSKRMYTLEMDARILAGVKFAAVGPATAKALREKMCIEPDLQPSTYTAEETVAEFRSRGIRPVRVLNPRSGIGRESLPKGLRSMGATVDEVIAYNTVIAEESTAKATRVYSDYKTVPHYTVFTSSSGVKNMVEILGGEVAGINKSCVISIGPITSETCGNVGINVAKEAETQTIQGLVDAISLDNKGNEA